MLRDITFALIFVIMIVYVGIMDRKTVTSQLPSSTIPQLLEKDKQRTPLELAKALDLDARRTFEATSGNQIDLQQDRRRAAELAETLADAKRNAALTIEEMQKRIDGEAARAARLDRDLLGLRERLAAAIRDVAARDDERRSLKLAEVDTEEKFQQEKRRAEELSDKLAEAQRGAAEQIEALRKEIESRPAPPERTDALVAEAPSEIPSPARGLETSDLPSPSAHPAAAGSTEVALPKDVPARLVLRYTLHSPSARTKALNISQTLRAQGFDVAEPVGSTALTAANAVTFFYDEDQSNADRVAKILVVSEPVRGRLMKDAPFPRPGTIEVSVAG